MSAVEYDHKQVLRTAILTDFGMRRALTNETTRRSQRDLQSAEALDALYRAVPSLPERHRRMVLEAGLDSDAADVPDSSFFARTLISAGNYLFDLLPGGVHLRHNAVIPWLEYFGAQLSPVPLVAACVYAQTRIGKVRGESVPDLLSFGSIPPPMDVDVLRMFDESNAAPADNHIHANNMASPILVWIRALETPYSWVAELFKRTRRDRNHRRLLGSLLPGMDSSELLEWIRFARWVRAFIVCLVLHPSELQNASNRPTSLTEASEYLGALASIRRPRSAQLPVVTLTRSWRDPSRLISPAAQSPCAREGLWWYEALRLLDRVRDERLERLLHGYHLVFALFQRIVSHAFELRGFDLFEAYASGPVRDSLENDSRVARQDGFSEWRRSNRVSHAELRIAPAKSGHVFLQKKVFPLIEAAGLPRDHRASARSTGEQPISIAVHFIKKRDSDAISSTGAIPRHARRRADLVFEMGAVQFARNRVPSIVAVDAANSEFHAGPEVFAPVFREMVERERFRSAPTPLRFTYHVGEEFSHPATGLRSVAEALEFLNLPDGSRLGHGMVLGLDVDDWAACVPGCLVTAQEWLDNLVWLCSDPRLLGNLDGWCRDCVASLSREIYGRAIAVPLLHAAWRLRELPAITFERNVLRAWRPRLDGFRREFGGDIYWSEDNQPYPSRQNRSPEAFAHDDPFEIHRQYQLSRSVRDSGSRIIEALVPSGSLARELDVALQNAANCLRERMAARRIAIECCPTSNLRITQVRRWREHPLFALTQSGAAFHADVTLCTDNPGLCQTSLLLEYAAARNIASTRTSPDEARRWLAELSANSRRLAFTV